jgi:hypothetical protein
MVEVHDTTYVERVRVDTLVEHAERTDTVYRTRVDTLREFRVMRDSVVVRDSVYVREKGDSVYVYREKWRTKVEMKRDTVYRAKVDTVYRAKVDTCYVYRFVERGDSAYVSKEKNDVKVKEKTGLWKRLTLMAVLLAVSGGIVWLIRKKGL